MNTAAKGRRQEHRSMRIHEAQGYTCIRSAASKGLWDYVAYNGSHFIFVQVRSSRPPSPAEMAVLAADRTPACSNRQVHIWRRGARAPEVRFV